jgi:hypothetical protein
MYIISKTKTENHIILKVIEEIAEENDVLFRTPDAAWNHLVTCHFYLDDEVFAAQISKAVQEGINDRKDKYSEPTQRFPTYISIEGVIATIYWHDLPSGNEIPRKSTVAALLKFMDESAGWAGDDFKKCLDEVYAMRGKVKFDVPDGHSQHVQPSH